MRTLDVSGLVALHTAFARAAWGGFWGMVYGFGMVLMPELANPWTSGAMGLLCGLVWLTLRRGNIAAARVLLPLLLFTLLVTMWQAWSVASSPLSNTDFIRLLVPASALYIPFHGLLGLWRPAARDAGRSPHAAALFARPPANGAVARMRRALGSIRLLPALVVIAMLAFVVVASYFLSEQQDRERANATQKSLQTALAAVGGGALLWARRRSARRGTEVRRVDARPPVLLLRSFGDDLMRIEKGAKYTRANDLSRQGLTFERIVANQLEPIGPVIAIGKPGEALAPLGAARDYVSNEVWQEEVAQRMRDAALIVLMLGSSEGLAWELLRVDRLQLLRRLVLVFPPAADLEARWTALNRHEAAAGVDVLPDALDAQRVLAIVWDAQSRPVALEGPRTEWAYEAALRVAAGFDVAERRAS